MKEGAQQNNYRGILDWLTHKEGKNEWILKCVSIATTKMNRDDWFTTSTSTNLAESAHALSQRDGTRLTLVNAIQMGKKIDHRFLESRHVAENMGIMSRWGNRTITGRTQDNLKRSKKATAKKNEKRATEGHWT